ncbi:hypothetical protein ACHAXA_004575 [Cyclostephanos tholiformis]|uniref:Glutathione S-transferase n=1 Tax=Cyclostephanos tholiformis TaxID=382380 RepID=A0ABD3R3B2_9STRA
MSKHLPLTAAKGTLPKLRYLSAWFCPYAHRATIALEHHAGRVEYEWVEVRARVHRRGSGGDDDIIMGGRGRPFRFFLSYFRFQPSSFFVLVPVLRRNYVIKQIQKALGWEQRRDEGNVTGTGKEWWYHWKADELRRSNPSGLVPTLIPVDADGTPNEERGKKNKNNQFSRPTRSLSGDVCPRSDLDIHAPVISLPVSLLTHHRAQSVYESLIVVDYVDAIANPQDEIHRLVPSDPYLAAKCRYWADRLNRECCSPYYGVLVRIDEGERRTNFDKLVAGLKAFSREIERNGGDGRGFLGGGRLSSADVSLMPWAYRYYIFEHYRGYSIPMDDPELHVYREWHDWAFSLDCVRRTLPDRDRYLEHIGKYADSSARSKVANAVRRGVAAHEIEDDKDTY